MIETPCQASDSPDDWFIARDGKQYPDDPWLTENERARIAMSVLRLADESTEDHDTRVRRAISAVEQARKRDALSRRRQAKEGCHECPLREECLGVALKQRPTNGTWGGFYEEEIRELYKRIDRRTI